MAERRIVIMGAAGRDFHNFNTVYREDPDVKVVAFTAAQIPRIAGRRYPAELAGERYPEGIAIVPEDDLEELIKRESIDEVVFAYSDVSHEYVMHQASRVLAAGANFALLGPEATMVAAEVPVISVGATRTGAGKSQTSRFLADLLLAHGVKPVIIRHPMPYGDLVRQRVQRFAGLDDMELHETTVEEREEYEPHLRRGLIVYAGVDYAAIVEEAQREASVIIWDGGNNDFSFVKPDLDIVVVDPFRPGHEMSYHPGEVSLRRAQVVVINKAGSAPEENVEQLARTVAEVNPNAVIVRADSLIMADESDLIQGKRVLVVEDGPTLTHGGMETGAGEQAARQYGAAEIVDPRPYAVGELASVYEKYSHLGPVLPAVGYFPEQLRDLEATIEAVPADVVVVATPSDVCRVINVNKPIVRVTYELSETGEPSLTAVLDKFLKEYGLGD
ncbi:MAG: GTPase [Actinobacteria bacterium]|nr:GTPase [Actinomycetota bacterium]